MPLIRTAKFLLGRAERFFIYRVLSLNDTPHRIALGVAIGIFFTWTPTIGFQMVLTLAFSWLLGANKFVGIPFVWISNPVTFLPIYGPNYLVGCWLTGSDFAGFRALREAMTFSGGWWGAVKAFWPATVQIFWELWLGSLLVAMLMGLLSYFAIRRAVVVFRRRHHARHPRAAEPEEPVEPKDAAP